LVDQRTGNDGFEKHTTAANHMTKPGREQVQQPITLWSKGNFLNFYGG